MPFDHYLNRISECKDISEASHSILQHFTNETGSVLSFHSCDEGIRRYVIPPQLLKLFIDALYECKVDVVGFDTETTISREILKEKVSLIQIAPTNNIAFLFPIYCYCTDVNNRMTAGFPKVLKKFLQDSSIKKVGINVSADAKKLKEGYGVNVTNLVDIEKLPILNTMHISSSLHGLCTHFTKQQWPVEEKSLEHLRTLNFDFRGTHSWEFDLAAIVYAARDAITSLLVYSKAMQL